jgi:hypothetical protein
LPAKSKIPEGKVYLNVLVSEDVYRMLVELAPVIYGKSHGSLSRVVEEALRLYLTPRRTHKYTQNPKLSVRDVYNEVVKKIMEIMNLDFKPSETSERTLDMAIMEVRGSDPRTVEKWKQLFARSGLIKFVAGSRPNRVVELL